jgi:membrane fusion protein (multidrug efflux system)
MFAEASVIGTRFLTLLVSACVAVGCGGKVVLEQQSGENVLVTTVEVKRRAVERVFTAVGTFEPVAKVLIAAQEEGLVTAIHVREGDVVAAGDTVVELDDREILASLAEARANLEEADAALARVRSLHGTGLAAPQELDAAIARQKVSAARADALGTRLSFTKIAAPVAGVVTARQVEVGDLASPRAPLLELASGEGMLLRVPVSELEVVRLHTSDNAKVTVDALPEIELEAVIQRIFPAADIVSRQVTVELKIDKVPEDVRFGFLGRAHLVLERLADALVVPELALQRGPEGGAFVWTVENGRAQMRDAVVGYRFDGYAVVPSGLAVGDHVVIEGVARLSEGIDVEIRRDKSEGTP